MYNNEKGKVNLPKWLSMNVGHHEEGERKRKDRDWFLTEWQSEVKKKRTQQRS